jgi:hypothetical protein
MNEIEKLKEEHLRELTAYETTVQNKDKQIEALAAENAALKDLQPTREMVVAGQEEFSAYDGDPEPDEDHIVFIYQAMRLKQKTPATDAVIADIEARARKQGAYFVANRMLAAWDAGFIDDTAINAADIARMILTSTEFMEDAPAGDFDRSFADEILHGIAQQLRSGKGAE